MVVVVRLEQLVRLSDDVAQALQLSWRDFEITGCVGEDVHVHRRLGTGRKIETLEMAPGIHRRINQRVVGRRLERGGVARLRGLLQGSTGLPARGQRHAGLVSDVAGVVASRIQRDLAPHQVQHVAGHFDRTFVAIARRQVLELHVDAGHALRHVDLERIHVVLVARPGQRLAVRRDHEASQLVDRAGRRMVARNPFRIQQGQLARLNRNGFVHAEDALLRIAGVDVDLDGANVRRVLRRRHVRIGGIGEGRAGNRCSQQCNTRHRGDAQETWAECA